MEYVFDLLATSYVESIKNLPESYVNLIQTTFNIQSQSKVIDLGCGSGLLTFPLAEISSFVSGLDISHNMIGIAKSQQKWENIEWIESSVDYFDFEPLNYDLIISYESMHLFPHTERLLQRCKRALKNGGAICMGWCFYNWELLLEEEIVSVFNNHNVIWGEWGFQKFLKFKDLIDSNIISGLTKTMSNYVDIYQEWPVDKIVEYITSISKAFELSDSEKILIKEELKDRIVCKYGVLIKGNTQYWIRYSKKIET